MGGERMKMKDMYKILLCGVMMLVSSMVMAQIRLFTFEKLTNDKSAEDYPVIDADGVRCALVRVYVGTEPCFYGDANHEMPPMAGAKPINDMVLFEDQNDLHPTEVWMYLNVSARRFRMYHSKYGIMNTGRNGYYYLSENLESGQTYRMTVSFAEDPQAVGVDTMVCFSPKELPRVTFSCTDNGHMAIVNGVRLKAGLVYRFVPGKYDIRFSKLHHKIKFKSIELSEGDEQHIDVDLGPRNARYVFGVGISKASDLGNVSFGVEAGVVRRFGYYLHAVFTPGKCDDLNETQLEGYTYNKFYNKRKCKYQSYNVGCLYSLGRHVILNLGMGYGDLKVLWRMEDGKWYNYRLDHVNGLSIDGGVKVTVSKIYLSGGVTLLKGNGIGNFGVGLVI